MFFDFFDRFCVAIDMAQTVNVIIWERSFQMRAYYHLCLIDGPWTRFDICNIKSGSIWKRNVSMKCWESLLSDTQPVWTVFEVKVSWLGRNRSCRNWSFQGWELNVTRSGGIERAEIESFRVGRELNWPELSGPELNVAGSGRNWAGRNWAGRNWAGRNWAGRNWAVRNWGPCSNSACDKLCLST